MLSHDGMYSSVNMHVHCAGYTGKGLFPLLRDGSGPGPYRSPSGRKKIIIY